MSTPIAAPRRPPTREPTMRANRAVRANRTVPSDRADRAGRAAP